MARLPKAIGLCTEREVRTVKEGKDIHETQLIEHPPHDSDKVLTTLEDLQRITGGAWNRKSFQMDFLSNGIRWIGYVIIVFVLMMAAIVILHFFNE